MKLLTYIFTLLFLSGFAGAATASAKSYSIENMDKKMFRWVHITVKRSPEKDISAGDANRLKKIILSDNSIDENEQEFLNILIENDYSAIKVSAQKTATFNPDDVVLKKAVSQDAMAVLKSIKEVEYQDLLIGHWKNGFLGFQALLGIYKSSPEGRQKVSKLYYNLVGHYFQNSNWQDGYAHFRIFLSAEMMKIKQLDGEDYRIAKEMLYNAIVAADKTIKSQKKDSPGIPKNQYEHLKPADVK